MQTREAKPDDIQVISELAHRIWKTYYPEIISHEQIDYMLDKMYSISSLEEQMGDGQQFHLLLDERKPIGYLSISDQGQHDFFLNKFYIDTALHRKGAGTILFNEVMATLPDIRSLRLTVNRQNYKAINFYFKLGFRIEEVKDFDIGNGYFMNDFVMRKDFQINKQG